jgi:hypothetical protein
MTNKSPVVSIAWSLAYILLGALVIRAALTSQPLRIAAAPQQTQRKSLKEAESSNPQVRVTKLTVAGHSKRFNEEFDEADDWPRRLSLEIENTADKPITFLTVNLNFPETRSSGYMMTYPVELGVRPIANPRAAAGKALRLMPGEKVQISLNDKYEALEGFIKNRHSMNQITKVEVEIGFIVFEDGIAWAAGDFLRPDPYNPRHYINIGRNVPK